MTIAIIDQQSDTLILGGVLDKDSDFRVSLVIKYRKNRKVHSTTNYRVFKGKIKEVI